MRLLWETKKKSRTRVNVPSYCHRGVEVHAVTRGTFFLFTGQILFNNKQSVNITAVLLIVIINACYFTVPAFPAWAFRKRSLLLAWKQLLFSPTPSDRHPALMNFS